MPSVDEPRQLRVEVAVAQVDAPLSQLWACSMWPQTRLRWMDTFAFV
jgi:hypothetical protein